MAHQFNVMVVDDSAVIRGLITRALEESPEIKVVASVADGLMAVQALEKAKQSSGTIDVIVLDIEMPVMDGLTAIPKLLAIDETIKIIMASTLTLRNAEISMQALQLGAADYIPKPSASGLNKADDFKRELVDKVKQLGQVAQYARGKHGAALTAPAVSAPRAFHVSSAATITAPAPAIETEAISAVKAPVVTGGAGALKPVITQAPDAIAIGSSTGGAQALFEVLKNFVGLSQPIFITQHMPPTFTTILAQQISKQCGVKCVEAQQNQQVEPGVIYLAPGDYHMQPVQEAGVVKIALNQEKPENFCRPAVDPMLRSLAQIYGRKLLTIILTGMGSDGAKGADSVVKAGGQVIAQDEATSVVWGMPRAVAEAVVCSAILPLGDIGPYVRAVAQKAAA